MGEVKVWSHNVSVTFYRLASLSFHVNRPSHSWDSTFSKFDLENPRPRSWARWTLNVTTWVQHSIDSHPFNSMSFGHPIPEIRLFQNLTLKIQGQYHGWRERWKSQSGCNILWTRIPFVPCQSALPFLRYSIFKIQMTMMLHNYRSWQFHRTSNGINPSSGFRDMGSAKSGPSAAWFDKFFCPWASPYWANGQITMTLHNYRSREVHETLNGVNPSSRYAFRSVWTQFMANLTCFGPMGKPMWCKWANDHDSAQLQA